MLFNTLQFILLFLPISLAGYYVIPLLTNRKLVQLLWLVAVSIFFYGYWNYLFMPVICVSILLNYSFGRLISSAPPDTARRKYLAVAAITVNLLALGFYKYANFAIDIVNSAHPETFTQFSVVLPLGISFFTFTQIAYLVDVYKNTALERSFIRYALFVSYFPHLIAGPILHHSEMMPQFKLARTSRPEASNWASGLTIFAMGLFKKVVIADGFGSIANPLFAAAGKSLLNTTDAWAGSCAYALQIYFDFSGYCDMAIGISLLFGIVLPFNFDAPYKSRSIVEFWRRWHITLSRLLRDYLYIPLGGNRKGPGRRNLNLFLTMVIGGLWHGAGWTFIVWGAMHGIFLLINHVWTNARKSFPGGERLARNPAYSVSCLLLTQLTVVVAWVFFRSENLSVAGRVVWSMFSLRPPSPDSPTIAGVLPISLIVLAYLACIVAPNVNSMFAGRNVGLQTYENDERWSIWPLRWRPTIAWSVVVSCILLVALLGILITGDSTQFLYFQF